MKLFDPKPGLKARLARAVLKLDDWGEEHIGCKESDEYHGYDAIAEGEGNYCCGYCGCCPCYSLRCDWCRPKRLKYEGLLDWLHGIAYVTSKDLTAAKEAGTL